MTASATAAVTKPVKKDSVPEIIAASMVGTAIEFYDNYCYSIAAASYFGMIFFTDAGYRPDDHGHRHLPGWLPTRL